MPLKESYVVVTSLWSYVYSQQVYNQFNSACHNRYENLNNCMGMDTIHTTGYCNWLYMGTLENTFTTNQQHTVEQYHSGFHFSDIPSNWDPPNDQWSCRHRQQGTQGWTTVAHNTTWKLSTVLQQSNTSLIWGCVHNTKVCKCTTCQDRKLSCTPLLGYVAS